MDGLHIDFTPVRAKMEGLDQVVLPKMVKIRQLYDSSRIEDVPTWLEKELEEKIQGTEMPEGKTDLPDCRKQRHSVLCGNHEDPD